LGELSRSAPGTIASGEREHAQVLVESRFVQVWPPTRDDIARWFTQSLEKVDRLPLEPIPGFKIPENAILNGTQPKDRAPPKEPPLEEQRQ
jgi:hypothetical protein